MLFFWRENSRARSQWWDLLQGFSVEKSTEALHATLEGEAHKEYAHKKRNQ
jgi:hypothetical protein